MFEIIPARNDAHMAVARELFVEYAAQLGHDFNFQDFAHELATLPGWYAPPAGDLLLAQAADGWAGCVAIRPRGPDICELKRMYVRRPHRGMGLGRRLAEQIVAVGRAAGYERVRLDTLASMMPARTLYASLGFRETEAYYDNPIPNVVYYELVLRA